MIRLLLKLIKALNSDASPWQLALAIAMGLLVGLTPLYSVHNLLLVLLVFMFRINLTAFFLATGFFTGLAYVLDTWSIQLGEYVLTHPGLQAFWTYLYQSEFWQLTHFNHTLTLGSLIIALMLWLPTLLLSKYLIVTYRVQCMTWVNQLKVVEMLKSTKLYQMYDAFSG